MTSRFGRSSRSSSGGSSGSRFGSSRSSSGGSGSGSRFGSSRSTRSGSSSSGSGFSSRRTSGGSSSSRTGFSSRRTSSGSTSSSRRTSGGFSSRRSGSTSRSGSRWSSRRGSDDREERGGLRASAVDATAIFNDLTAQFDPSHVDCKFQAFFFNKHEDNTIVEPPEHVPRSVWLQVQQNNPDKKAFAPVEIRGFDQLQERISKQRERCKQHKIILANVAEQLDSMKQRHALSVSKIQAARVQQQELTSKVLIIAKKMEVLRARGLPISAMEEDFRMRVDHLLAELSNPQQFTNHTRELKSLVAAKQSRPAENFKILEEEDVENVSTYLQEQQNGISQLVSILKKDMADVKLMYSEYVKQQS